MLETYVLHITKECNMKCVYCYEQDKSSVYTWEQIKEILDNIIKYNKEFSLEFLGGEPCLRTDLIKQTVEYLENISDITVQNYHVITNGTIIDDTLIDVLKNYTKVSWTASMDGTRFMNSLRIDKKGYNSYDKVVENFKKLYNLLDNDANKQLGIHPVTHPFNIAYFNDGIEHLYNLGFRRFGIGTVESTIVIDDNYCKIFVEQLKKLSYRIVNGEFPEISVSVLDGLKPKSDQRYYIKDETGKTVLETYGRAEGDIKDSESFKTNPSESHLGDMIYNIREEVYLYHQNNIKQ